MTKSKTIQAPSGAAYPDNSPAFQGWVKYPPTNESRQGRQKMVAVRKDLSSLTGLSFKPGTKPSHKWLGYFQSRQTPSARRGWSAVCPKPQRVAGGSDWIFRNASRASTCCEL
jgi:hypothetical protein